MTTKVKLYISYKDEHRLLKNEIIQPVQTGRAIASKHFEGMLGDDTGDNISADNPRYNELSAQYWVWTHYEELGNPEYVGFMHYRRHFVFNKELNLQDKKPWFNKMPIYQFPKWEKACEENLDPKHILNTLQSKADCYAIKPYDVRFLKKNNLFMKEHFLNTIPGAKRMVWDVFYQVVAELYPQDKDILEDFAYGSTMNACNMFIMKKELFFEYSEFCFNILKEIDKRVDSSNFVGPEIRFIGYLGEYVLTLFIMKLNRRGAHVEYLDAILISQTDKQRVLPPVKINFWKKIFSVTRDHEFRTIRFLGFKIKIRRKKELDQILFQLRIQNRMLSELENKIVDLEEELFLSKKRELANERKNNRKNNP